VERDARGGLYAQPLVVGNTVYAATQNNTVYAFAADTGNPVWAQPQHVANAPRLSSRRQIAFIGVGTFEIHH